MRAEGKLNAETPPSYARRRQSVQSNSIWNVASYVGTSVALFATTSIAVRSLSRDEFGLFALLVTISALLPLLDLGLRSPVTVAAAQSESESESQSSMAAARQQFHAGRDAYRLLSIASAVPWMAASVVVLTLDLSPSGATAAELALTIAMLGLAATLIVLSASTFALATARAAYRFMGLSSIAGQLTNLLLVFTLIDTLGIVALGAGQLCNVVVSRGCLLLWVNRTTGWLSRRWRLPAKAEVAGLGQLAGPALVLSLSTQFVAVTDVLLLSSLAGTAAVAAYRLGAIVPTQSLALLFRAVDVVFPSMAASRDREEQERLASRATQWGALLAGTGFGVLVALRDEAVVLLTGRQDQQVALLLVLFCAVWACNVPMHAWGLLLLARNDQRLLAPLVVLEAVVNFVLTVALIPILGVVGAVVGTLSAMILSAAMLQPLRLRRHFSPRFTRSVYLNGFPLLALSAALPLLTALAAPHWTVRVLVCTALLAGQPAAFALWQRRRPR